MLSFVELPINLFNKKRKRRKKSIVSHQTSLHVCRGKLPGIQTKFIYFKPSIRFLDLVIQSPQKYINVCKLAESGHTPKPWLSQDFPSRA